MYALRDGTPRTPECPGCFASLRSEQGIVSLAPLCSYPPKAKGVTFFVARFLHILLSYGSLRNVKAFFTFGGSGWTSLACGQATAVATVHRTIAKSRLSNPFCLAANAPNLISRFYGAINGVNPLFYAIKKALKKSELFYFWWERMDSNHRSH